MKICKNLEQGSNFFITKLHPLNKMSKYDITIKVKLKKQKNKKNYRVFST